MSLFMESLRIMGTGMLGVFAVAGILIAVMKVLTTLFPGKQSRLKKARESGQRGRLLMGNDSQTVRT